MKWLSCDEAISNIRPENEEKRRVLLRVHKALQTYCPLALTKPERKRLL
jgi:hypothetical protein